MYTVTGIQKVDYVSKKTGKAVNGYNLWLSYQRDGVIGHMTDRQYVSQAFCERSGYVPAHNQVVDLRFVRNGDRYDLDRIDVISSK